MGLPSGMKLTRTRDGAFVQLPDGGLLPIRHIIGIGCNYAQHAAEQGLRLRRPLISIALGIPEIGSPNKEEKRMPQQHYGEGYGGSAPENYERYFVPVIGALLADDLMKVAAIRLGERVLDVACGTGVVARLAAQRVGADGTVAGLDINPDMLAVARSTTPPRMAIDWYEASAEAMPLPDAWYDAVLCQMGLQLVADKAAALREMHRVLAPGGRLVLNVPGPTPPLMAVMAEALAQHIGAEAAGFVHLVFSFHDTAELQNLMSGAGFRDVSVEADTRSLRLPAPEEFFWQYVYSTPLAGAVAKADLERRASLERRVVAKWQEFVKDRAMVLQVRMVVATGRK